jgi:hypothetical protein
MMSGHEQLWGESDNRFRLVLAHPVANGRPQTDPDLRALATFYFRRRSPVSMSSSLHPEHCP